MSMRLLPKQEIVKAKAAEKKQEIDEGVKLARRVDSLRELAAQEETSLQTFRRETVANINKEIEGLGRERDAIKQEVATLKAEREEERKPLDAERDALKRERFQFERDKRRLNEREAQIRNWEQEALVQRQLAREELLSAKDERLLTAKLLKTTSEKDVEATVALAHADRIKSEALRHAERFNKDVVRRNAAIAARERDLELRSNNLDDKEQALEKEWKILEDRKAMFERGIKRK